MTRSEVLFLLNKHCRANSGSGCRYCPPGQLWPCEAYLLAMALLGAWDALADIARKEER